MFTEYIEELGRLVFEAPDYQLRSAGEWFDSLAFWDCSLAHHPSTRRLGRIQSRGILMLARSDESFLAEQGRQKLEVACHP